MKAIPGSGENRSPSRRNRCSPSARNHCSPSPRNRFHVHPGILFAFARNPPNWFTAAAGAANRLFGLLALIEFAWTAVILVLYKSDLQGWTAALIRRI
ncbi:MAG: hypothetical protein ACRD4E_11430, partial [Bryobacteraceae bacterium]